MRLIYMQTKPANTPQNIPSTHPHTPVPPGMQVYVRKGRLLLALQAVKQALRLAGPAHPRVHLALLRLALRAAQPAAGGDSAVAAGSHPLVGELLQQGVVEALGGLSPQAYHEAWVGQHGSSSLAAAAAAAEGAVALQPERAAAAAEQLLQGVLWECGELGAQGRPFGRWGRPGYASIYVPLWLMARRHAAHPVSKRGCVQGLAAGASRVPATNNHPVCSLRPPAADPASGSHADCVAAHRLLGGPLGAAAAAEQWRQRCAGVFRWSRYFGGADVVPLEELPEVNGVAEKVAALAV